MFAIHRQRQADSACSLRRLEGMLRYGCVSGLEQIYTAEQLDVCIDALLW